MSTEPQDRGWRAGDGRRAGDTLVRRSFAPRYETLLRQHLPPDFAPFAGFFADLSRLETMAAMLQDHLPARAGAILNAGCGPFASEIFVAAFQNRRVTAFDYTAEFARFYDVFRTAGLLESVTFQQADAMGVDFASSSFDLIVMHDLLYEESLDLDRLLERYRFFLAPGGLVYFDVMNSGTRWLWRLLGKEKTYRRYSRAEVLASLARHGFDLLDERPVAPGTRPVKIILHGVLRHLFGTSNATALVARLRPTA